VPRRIKSSLASSAIRLVATCAALLFGGMLSGVDARHRINAPYFYRFTTQVTEKFTGDIIKFDVVIACQPNIAKYRNAMWGVEGHMTTRYRHQYYVILTKQNDAIGVSVPDACSGQTSGSKEHGGVPDDLLPLIVWYTMANLKFGQAYLTADAYASEYARISRPTATSITEATLEEWQAFDARAVDENIVPLTWHGSSNVRDTRNPSEHGMTRLAGMTKEQLATECFAYQRVKLSAAGRLLIKNSRPVDATKYWTWPLNTRACRHLSQISIHTS
jgi:hypothetical protein